MKPETDPQAPPALSWRQGLAWVGVLLVLGTVFMAYLQPHVAVDLALRLWACF
ncbi:MAG: hypothetical protein ACKVQR_16480 [Aquabacterium sp.]